MIGELLVGEEINKDKKNLEFLKNRVFLGIFFEVDV